MSNKVSEIHTGKRKKMWDESIKSHQKYIDSETGDFRKEFVENRNCPVCQKNTYTFMFKKEGGDYVKCDCCQMVYLNPVFIDDQLIEYYRNNHAEQSGVVADDTDFYTDLYSQGADSIENNVSVGSILDVGCSGGAFLDLAKQRGWETHGIELNQVESSLSRKKGHIVYGKVIGELSLDNKFEAISLWDVFEHIKDGGKALASMSKLLTENGVIFLQIPSADSLAARILHEKCNMFDGLEHVNLYGAKTLAQLLEKNNLKILEIKSVIPEFGVLNNYMNYENAYYGQSQSGHDVLDFFSSDEVLDKLLGYKLQVVIGKNKDDTL